MVVSCGWLLLMILEIRTQNPSQNNLVQYIVLFSIVLLLKILFGMNQIIEEILGKNYNTLRC